MPKPFPPTLAVPRHVDVVQNRQEILVKKHLETNRERQDILGEFEEADGVEGSVGRIEA